MFIRQKTRSKSIILILIVSLFIFFGCKKDETKDTGENSNAINNIEYSGTITLGINLPTTGPYADQGNDELRAFKLAIEDLNLKGGILNNKVEFALMDSKSKPDIAVENVNKLIDVNKVKMITGGVSSGVAVAVSKVCQNKKTIFMATVTHSDSTTGDKAHRHMFRKCTSATMDAKALSTVLAKYYSKGKSYFYITADYTWGWSTEKAIRKIVEKAGAKTVKAFKTPLGNKDFSIALNEVKKDKPDVLVLVLFGDDMVNAAKQLTEMGLKESLELVVVPYIELNMAIKAGPDVMSGIVASVPWYWELDELYPKSKIFVDSFKKKFNRYPSNAAESAYMCIMEYADAAERAKSFDSIEIIKALENHEFIGLKDKEVWRGWDHQSIQTVYIVQGKKPDEMENEYDFFELISKTDGNSIARTKEENPIVLEPLE